MQAQDFPKITLAAARVNAGMSQQEAAKALGISVATLQNYESGKTIPQWSTVQKIEDVYKFPVDYIFFVKKFALSELPFCFLAGKIIIPHTPSHSPYFKEVNRMDKTLGKSSGKITIDVHLNGLDEQLAKAHELVETIRKARSLADDLAHAMENLEAEV